MARAYMKGLIGIGLAGILTMTSAGPVSAGVDDGLVGYWSFDGNANDNTGNGHDGTVLGPTLAPDAYGNANSAYAFAGSSLAEHIRVAHDPALNLHTDFSISFWVNQEETGWHSLVLGKGQDVLNSYFFIRFAGSNVIYFITRPNDLGPVDLVSVAVPFGEWHHLTGVYSETAGKMRLYLDGALAAEQNIAHAPFTTTNTFPLVIGRLYINPDGSDTRFSYPFRGALDEIRIYDRALSPVEVASVYDPVPPVVTLNGDATVIVECHTGTYTDPGATALDNVDGDLTSAILTTGSVDIDVPGTYQITYSATDAANNTGSAVRTVEVVDTTPPSVAASLVPVPRPSRHDDDDDDPEYRRHVFTVRVSASDACDPQPALTAFISQPVASSSAPVVNYERARKNKIEIKQHKKGIRVKLEGPDEAALRALWDQAISTGGFAVADGQVVRLVAKREEHSEAKFHFDRDLALTSAKGPGLKLVAFARDASGNTSEVAEVAPSRSRDAKPVARTSPRGVALLANYPNPFNPSTTVPYVLAEAGLVKLSVYNVLGQEVRVLVDQLQVPGSYTVSWDARDGAGQVVAPGLYLYYLEAGTHRQVRKMLLAK